jgi:hypothetical protein
MKSCQGIEEDSPLEKREGLSFTERFSSQVFRWALMENKGLSVSV